MRSEQRQTEWNNLGSYLGGRTPGREAIREDPDVGIHEHIQDSSAWHGWRRALRDVVQGLRPLPRMPFMLIREEAIKGTSVWELYYQTCYGNNILVALWGTV